MMTCFKLRSCSAIVLLLAVASAAAGAGVSLVDAVKRGDSAAVRSLLQKHVDVNEAEPDGTAALHWAVHNESVEIADLLIRGGASVKAANRYGATPLWLAAVSGNAAMIEVLLKAGADANAANPHGETPLLAAARSGEADAVRVLLERGAYRPSAGGGKRALRACRAAPGPRSRRQRGPERLDGAAPDFMGPQDRRRREQQPGATRIRQPGRPRVREEAGSPWCQPQCSRDEAAEHGDHEHQ